MNWRRWTGSCFRAITSCAAARVVAPVSALSPASLLRYVPDLLARSRRLFLVLAKIMLPVMVIVQIAQYLGWIDALGRALGPAMAWLTLPAEAGLIWITAASVGIYGGIAAMISLSGQLALTSGQLSALCAMMLFAHNLPVEQSIVRRAGVNFLSTGLLRITVALLYGGLVAWASRLTGILDQSVSFVWMQAPAGEGSGTTGAQDLWTWVLTTAGSLVITFLILVLLLILLDILEHTGVTRRITALLLPLMRLSGLEARAAPITTVGVLLGLTYGGALIIEESERQAFRSRTRFLALAWLCLSHALIEDTLLLLAVGADIWVILVGRVAVTLLLIALLARWLGDHETPGAQAAGSAATT